MVSEARKQAMAWMETDYSKHTHFRWKIKWRLEHLGVLGIMGKIANNAGSHRDKLFAQLPNDLDEYTKRMVRHEIQVLLHFPICLQKES